MARAADAENGSAAQERSPESDDRRLRAEVVGLLEQLDSSSYTARRGAAERLETLVRMPDHGALLAAEFYQALREPEISFEVRWHLERWRRCLPEVAFQPPGSASSEELDQVVAQLEADTYAVRLGAVGRLEWLLGNGKLVGPITSRIKALFKSPELSNASAQQLDQVWNGLRPFWSQSDPADWELPEVSDEVIRGWVDELAQAAPAGSEPRRQLSVQAAERELRDLLMRDEYVPRVAAELAGRLDTPAAPETHARLQTLFDKTRPAMVAEFWQNRQHLVEQHLLVDVPSQTAGAPRPSHFSQIDDQVAQCVSGSSLSPGEYPVGVAIPHPRTPDALFHLINLPTPRRRLWYQRHTTIDPAVRLREISRCTVEWLREQKRPLDQDALRMLAGLDPVEVSRFAKWYFTAVADSAFPPWQARPDPYAPGQFLPIQPPAYPGGQPSRHGALCMLLAADGTREAAPGLLEAIQQNRVLPPLEQAPYRLDWIAALSIAHRDPWPEVDHWLGHALANEWKLRIAEEPAAEVGATAAAILLARHGQRFADFGLQPVGDEVLAAMGLSGYRFANHASRQSVLQWHAEIRSDASGSKAGLSGAARASARPEDIRAVDNARPLR